MTYNLSVCFTCNIAMHYPITTYNFKFKKNISYKFILSKIYYI